ncbi:MAG: ribosome biogenesis GTPase Der [Deltaproteobacteria bacterium]|nr:ribosome biogenesis GTPase Der [Deltaproteobacteria bacterium]
MRAPVLAIVGRPNVGKSTLFNRLAGRRIAIVEDLPGVTRDRLYAECLTDMEGPDGKSFDVRFTIIDTGGFEAVPSTELFALVREQTQLAIEEADVIIHVVDAQLGVSPDDADVAKILRRSGRPVIVAANKIDHPNHEPLIGELYALGVERVTGISASHGRGIADLLDLCWSLLPEPLREGARVAAIEDESVGGMSDDMLDEALDRALEELENAEAKKEDGANDDDEADDDAGDAPAAPTRLLRAVPEVLRLAVVGRPNAGKSSFVNKLLGEERHLVSDMPGTTMDAVDSFVEYGGSRFRVIDTAGIRRKRSIALRVEKYAVVAALRGMDRADIVVHLIDATAGLTEQDKRIAAFTEQKGKAIILVINKWDLAKEKGMDADVYAGQVRQQVSFIDHAPIRFVSAKTGKRVHDVLATAVELAKRHFQRISTSQVNKVLAAAVDGHQPPMHRGKRVRFYFATQVRTAPPTFVIATNDTDGVHFSYRRYLVNQFREAFDFGGAPMRLIFRRRDGDRLKTLTPVQRSNRKLKREESGRPVPLMMNKTSKPKRVSAPKKATKKNSRKKATIEAVAMKAATRITAKKAAKKRITATKAPPATTTTTTKKAAKKPAAKKAARTTTKKAAKKVTKKVAKKKTTKKVKAA